MHSPTLRAQLGADSSEPGGRIRRWLTSHWPRRAAGSPTPSTAGQPTRRGPVFRWARRIALALAALAVLYLVLVNVLLGTPLLARIVNAKEPKVKIEYTSAWSIWPGRIEVRDLRVSSQSKSAEWAITFHRLAFSVDVLALTDKVFEASDIDAVGVAFRFRPRFDSYDEAKEKRSDMHPPISGFLDPSLRDVGPPEPPSEDGWGVRLEDFELIGVREIWVNEYRFDGVVRAKGRLVILPHRQIAVGPAEVAIDAGMVRVGEFPMATELAGQLDGTVDAFDPDALPEDNPLAVFQHISGGVHVLGVVPDARFLARWLSDPAGPTITDARGIVQVGSRMDHGKLSVGSFVRVETERARGSLGEYTASWHAETNASVEVREDGRPEAKLSTRLLGLEIRRKGFEDDPVRVPQSRVSARSAEIDLTGPFSDLRASLDAPAIEVTNLRMISSYLPKKDGLGLDGGAVTLGGSVHVSVPEARASGAVALAATQVAFRYAGVSFRGNGKSEVKLGTYSFTSGKADLDGSWVDLRDVIVRQGGDRRDPWWGRVDLTKAEVRTTSPGYFMATALTRARDAGPILEILQAKTPMPGLLGDLFSMKDLTGSAQMTFADEVIDLRRMRAKGDGISIAGQISKIGDRKSGAFLFVSKIASFGLDIEPDGVKPQVLDTEDWFKEEERRLPPVVIGKPKG